MIGVKSEGVEIGAALGDNSAALDTRRSNMSPISRGELLGTEDGSPSPTSYTFYQDILKRMDIEYETDLHGRNKDQRGGKTPPFDALVKRNRGNYKSYCDYIGTRTTRKNRVGSPLGYSPSDITMTHIEHRVRSKIKNKATVDGIEMEDALGAGHAAIYISNTPVVNQLGTTDGYPASTDHTDCNDVQK